MTAANKTRDMGSKEFMEVAASLEPKIKACEAATGQEKVMALEVLAAVARSVQVNGTQQHGMKKTKLKAALKVFGQLATATEENSEAEQAVLNALVMIAAGAMHK